MAASIRSGLQDDFDATILLVPEHLVHLWSLLERCGVGDDEGRIDLSLFDAAQQVVGPAIDMRLAHPEGQTLVHREAHRDLVHKAAIDARNGVCSGAAAYIYHFAQDMGAVAF